jgi:hypothetical protein
MLNPVGIPAWSSETIGMVRVAFFSLGGRRPACNAGIDLKSHQLAASSGSRSTRSCAHFHSIATVLPST